MESPALKPNKIIEINIDVSPGTSSLSGHRKICGGSTCNFSNAKTSSKDAKERSASLRKLLTVVVLCIIFMAVEVVGGIKANSLAILTDAAHLLSDVAAFAISLFSIWASGWEATPRQSYGFFRIEILGALVSIQLIWLLAGILVYQAIVRIIHDTGEVKGSLMFAVSTFGLVMNIIMAVLLGHDHGHGHGGHGDGHGHGHGGHDGHVGHDHGHGHGHGHGGHDHGHDHSHDHSHHDHDHDHNHDNSHEHEEHEPFLTTADSDESKQKKREPNINVHSAYLHVLGDFVQSIGVMIGGAIIWYNPEWKIVDLICTLVFSVIVLVTTMKMLRNILEVLMESTPRAIDATRLGKGLCDVEGVVAIHELHIWAITVGKVLLACHVMISLEADADKMLDRVIGYIRREYNITHVTIQIERQ